jgi:RimJ/RimL family protein N-acetyltransferase
VCPSPEIGYSIHPDYWDKAYATETLNGLLELWWSLPRQSQDGDVVEETGSVFAICEKNLGSAKVLRNVPLMYSGRWLWNMTVGLMSCSSGN